MKLSERENRPRGIFPHRRKNDEMNYYNYTILNKLIWLYFRDRKSVV